jgi:hypothetical protein
MPSLNLVTESQSCTFEVGLFIFDRMGVLYKGGIDGGGAGDGRWRHRWLVIRFLFGD